AVLRASDIHNTFADAMAAEDWAAGMPTNVVLISGPSKTADIELVLAFGIHGPKELVVFIRADEA
ncbi:MAG: LUD domain-containing protein, partial [Desulfococcaceae bacterium]